MSGRSVTIALAAVGALGALSGCGKRALAHRTSTRGENALGAGDDGVRPSSMSAFATEGGPQPITAADGVQTTATGLRMLVLRPGQGHDHPALSDRVRVHYSGWTKDGALFGSTLARGVPDLFTLSQTIPGWTEALELMVEGEKRRLWVPAKLAYGDDPLPGAPEGNLTYEIELVEVIHSPKRPEDVASPPKGAKVTQSGLSYRVLRPGTGKAHPRPGETITVQYSGWTTDGLLFDSSLLRGGPSHFTVGSLIKGWNEAAMPLVVGERSRFWMPAALGYGDHPKDEQAPAGMLVFDIDLLGIGEGEATPLAP